MSQYIVHKAVEFAAVKVAVRKELGAESVDDLATTHYFQRKYDGCNGVLKLTPNGLGDVLLSRTGEVVKSCDHIIKSARMKFNDYFLRGMGLVLLGEVWRPNTEFARISGEFRKHDPVTLLKFVAFDMLPMTEFDKGASELTFEHRYTALMNKLRGFHQTDTIWLAETYTPGSYGLPTEFATKLVEEGGYDGGILRNPLGTWTAGSGTDGEIIKVKAAESYDLRVVDVEEGKGKYKGTLGALVCQGPKGHVKVSGMTDEERNYWFAAPQTIIGAIVEVQCLGLTNTGSLREPRFKGIRHDKITADFE
jgi:DNA ligase-1